MEECFRLYKGWVIAIIILIILLAIIYFLVKTGSVPGIITKNIINITKSLSNKI